MSNDISEFSKDRAKFFAKISRITGAIGNLKKDSTNKFHKYNYVSADSVVGAIAPLMAKENLALISETLDVTYDDKVYMPKYRFTFVCGDTGYMLPCIWYGETIHTSVKGTRDDKALNKSATISQKYFLLKTFMIATGDDPDGNEDGKGGGQQQQNQPSDWATKVKVDELIDYWHSEGLEVSDILRFADVKDRSSLYQWNNHDNRQEATIAIQKAFNTELEQKTAQVEPETNSANGDRPAVYECEFTHMRYAKFGQTYLNFANCDPADDECANIMTVIRAYGRSTTVRDWLGYDIYDTLNLAQYEDVEETTVFIKMAIPVGFRYIQETPKDGTPYLKAIGIVGEPPQVVEQPEPEVTTSHSDDETPF